ncbi:hypothetical protein E2C01_049752 [Portunus trituberculatus]|uniref:Uncharacterized protein n=1 Tax=Portunus trituberculatus TaxID=210409 RepID=A0A5B7GEN2_PORTR|nr:hypothetical protein [Portunus trituberculatus]
MGPTHQQHNFVTHSPATPSPKVEEAGDTIIQQNQPEQGQKRPVRLILWTDYTTYPTPHHVSGSLPTPPAIRHKTPPLSAPQEPTSTSQHPPSPP